MFANCQMGGMNMATPDVCKTPSPPGSPIPIPYPNIAQGATANPSTAAKKVLISGTPAHTLQTNIPMSNGDEPGVVGGIISGVNMGPSKHLMGASNVLIGGSPATKMTDQTGQNGTSFNAQGMTTAPAQTKVMINSGGSGGGGGASVQAQQSSNTTNKSNKPVKTSIKNPRWEHSDQKVAKMREEATLIGDKIVLKADVTNVPDGTSIVFSILDSTPSPSKEVCKIYGRVINGVGSAEWHVKHQLKYEFSAKVRSLVSEKNKVKVGNVYVFSF